MKNGLLARIHDRSARIGIIGQGYVGLPLALLFHEAGFRVTGFDLDPRKVEALRKGESFIKHIGAERVAAAVRSGKYQATTDFEGLRDCDAIAICVPTPLGDHREPDNSYIHATGREIAKRLRKGQLVHPRVDHLPGHHRRGAPPHPGDERPQVPARLLPRLLARARGPGPQGLRHEDHRQGRGRGGRRLHRAGRGPLPDRRRQGGAGLVARGWPSRPSSSRTSSVR